MRLNSDETSSSDGGGTEGILWSVGVRNGGCSSMGSILGVIFFGMSVDEELGSVYRFRSKQGTIESIFCNYSRDFVRKEIRENSAVVLQSKVLLLRDFRIGRNRNGETQLVC